MKDRMTRTSSDLALPLTPTPATTLHPKFSSTLALTPPLAYFLKHIDTPINISAYCHNTLFVTTASSTAPYLTTWNQSDA